MDGTSAVVAAREGGSAVIYAMFFKWTGERWEKGKIFLEPYEELLENEDHTYDFHLDMSGRTAMGGRRAGQAAAVSVSGRRRAISVRSSDRPKARRCRSRRQRGGRGRREIDRSRLRQDAGRPVDPNDERDGQLSLRGHIL